MQEIDWRTHATRTKNELELTQKSSRHDHKHYSESPRVVVSKQKPIRHVQPSSSVTCPPKKLKGCVQEIDWRTHATRTKNELELTQKSSRHDHKHYSESPRVVVSKQKPIRHVQPSSFTGIKVSLKLLHGNTGLRIVGILLSPNDCQWDLDMDGINIYYYMDHRVKIPSGPTSATLLVRSLGGEGGTLSVNKSACGMSLHASDYISDIQGTFVTLQRHLPTQKTKRVCAGD